MVKRRFWHRLRRKRREIIGYRDCYGESAL
jgi:hypothetical protein